MRTVSDNTIRQQSRTIFQPSGDLPLLPAAGMPAR